MLSRRIFLLGALAGFVATDLSPFALAKKSVEVKALGPHTLAKEEWPPAITPDFAAIVDKGYALVSDQSGRLAIVDFKRESGPLVIGELVGIGKSISDLATTAHRAYAITSRETPSGEAQHLLTTISITPANDPSVMSQEPLSYFAEPGHIAASGDVVAVSGVGLNGENQIALYSMARKRAGETSLPIATITASQPVVKLNLDEKQLTALEVFPPHSTLQFFSTVNVRSPQKIGEVKLDGIYTVMARSREFVAVAGQRANKTFDVQLISTKNAPHVVARANLPLTEVLDIAVQKGQLLVLGNQSGRQAVIPVTFGKADTLAVGAPVLLPAGSHGVASQARIVAREKDAYVISDWGGVQVLDISKNGWQYKFSHTIPRLPAAAIAVEGNRAVLGGADLKVYDISLPQQPTLLSTAEVGSTVRSVVIANGMILALSHDALTLRRLDKPGEVLASVKVNGQALIYDKQAQRAYVLTPHEQTTLVSSFRVGTTLTPDKAQEVQGSFRDGSGNNGRLLLGGLSTLALFDKDLNLQAARTFPNFALRDITLLSDRAIITTVDAASHGHILVINPAQAELPTIGSVDLPSDAVALAVSNNEAVVVGRESAGKDVASIIDITNPPAPKVVSSFPVLEAAAAVAIKDRLALVAGRGLEILSLS